MPCVGMTREIYRDRLFQGDPTPLIDDFMLCLLMEMSRKLCLTDGMEMI